MMSYQADEAVSGFELDRQITQVQWQYNLQVNHAVRLTYKRIEYDFFVERYHRPVRWMRGRKGGRYLI